MASSINAATAGAGGVITQADNSGILNLQSGGTTVATINSTGIVMASNTAPAFSAYASATTAIANNVKTKINFATEEFDTNNNFASSRFTPTIAGYYQINSCAYILGNTGFSQIIIIKNGSEYKSGAFIANISTVGGMSNVSSIVYFNGSTDYVEIQGYQNTGVSQDAQPLLVYTYFNGCFVRSA